MNAKLSKKRLLSSTDDEDIKLVALNHTIRSDVQTGQSTPLIAQTAFTADFFAPLLIASYWLAGLDLGGPSRLAKMPASGQLINLQLNYQAGDTRNQSKTNISHSVNPKNGVGLRTCWRAR